MNTPTSSADQPPFVEGKRCKRRDYSTFVHCREAPARSLNADVRFLLDISVELRIKTAWLL